LGRLSCRSQPRLGLVSDTNEGGAVLPRLTTEIINTTETQGDTAMVLIASNYDQSKFFKAADLQAEKKLRIKSVTEEEIGENKERKLCVWFTNDSRGLVLNKTNNRTLRGAFGDACDDWRSRIIVVFPTTDEFRGRMVPVLRVRIPPPKQAAAGNGRTAVDDGLEIPESLRRTPKPAVRPAAPPDED